MRVIAHNTLVAFWTRHPEARVPLRFWEDAVRAADWQTMQQVMDGLSGAKSLNGERARFAVAGGNYRLIAAFNFKHGIAYGKFIGTHEEYDRVDALTVDQF